MDRYPQGLRQDRRKRSLSIEMIRRLHQELGISAEILIRPARENAAA
jgi:HTH-type transcriptional regulator/antitoxin HigA